MRALFKNQRVYLYLEDFSSPYLPFWILITKFAVKLFYQLCLHFLLLLDLADILVHFRSCP